MELVTTKIMTARLSYKQFRKLSEDGYIPIIAIRSISNSPLVREFSNSPIHFRELSPSRELLVKKRLGLIDFEQFRRLFLLEMANKNLLDIIKRISSLVEIHNAKGAVIFGYDEAPTCHRTILSEIFNETGLMESPLKEVTCDEDGA